MKALLTANWTNLLTATFEADKKLLQPFIPAHTELNDWNGKYLMSLVGFLFSKPYIYSIPSPFYRRFEEVNLRFYVRHKSKSGWRKGVVFIKEIAPSRMIGRVAKWLYHENFICLPVKYKTQTDKEKRSIEYSWKVNGKWNFLKLRASVNPLSGNENTVETFIKEHYWGYTKNNNQSFEFEIQHPPWSVYPGLSFEMNLDANTIYGEEFTDYFAEKPVTTFLMDGSQTKVSNPVLL
jgi:uncharacterized protein YqjF (DUF2071 family)